MKTFVIEVELYPQEFTISAETEQEAKELAVKRYADSEARAGIMSVNVLEKVK